MENKACGNDGQGQLDQVEAEAQGHELGGDRGADVGAVDDADGLGELQDAGVHKAHAEDGDGGAALDQRREEDAHEEGLPKLTRDLLKKLFHHAAAHAFETVSHEVHAVHEEGRSAEDAENKLTHVSHHPYSDIRFVSCQSLNITITLRVFLHNSISL